MLSPFAVQNAKAQNNEYKLSDGNGLHLIVTTGGSKLWRLRYRFGGKQKMLSLGAFPEISLATARTRRDDARKLIANGLDPSTQRKEDKAKSKIVAANTFGLIAKEQLEKLREEGKAPTTLEKNRWICEDLARDLTDRPITEITPAEILAILRKVEKSGRKETARRMRGAIGRIFRYAIITLRATTDPTFALKRALTKPVVTHRAAITDEVKLGALLSSIDEYDGWPTIRSALQFLTLTMARPSEVRFMRKSEINFIKATWNVPERVRDALLM